MLQKFYSKPKWGDSALYSLYSEQNKFLIFSNGKKSREKRFQLFHGETYT